jgi:hypothetical protein
MRPDVAPDGPNDNNGDIEQNSPRMIVVKPAIQDDDDNKGGPEGPGVLSPLVGQRAPRRKTHWKALESCEIIPVPFKHA